MIGVTLKMELVNVMSIAYYFVFIVNLNFGTNMQATLIKLIITQSKKKKKKRFQVI